MLARFGQAGRRDETAAAVLRRARSGLARALRSSRAGPNSASGAGPSRARPAPDGAYRRCAAGRRLARSRPAGLGPHGQRLRFASPLAHSRSARAPLARRAVARRFAREKTRALAAGKTIKSYTKPGFGQRYQSCAAEGRSACSIHGPRVTVLGPERGLRAVFCFPPVVHCDALVKSTPSGRAKNART